MNFTLRRRIELSFYKELWKIIEKSFYDDSFMNILTKDILILRVNLCVCVCMYMCEKERQKESIRKD